jgi:hypothetical protein
MPSGRDRNSDGGQNLARVQSRKIGALIKGSGGHVARPIHAGDFVNGAEALHQRRHVVARIAIGDIAAHCSLIANLRVRDQQRGFADDRNSPGKQVGGDHFILGRHRADLHVGAKLLDALQTTDRRQIDEMFGRRHAGLHQRNEAVPASQGARVFTKLCQNGKRVGDGSGTMVIECARYHERSSPSRRTSLRSLVQETLDFENRRQRTIARKAVRRMASKQAGLHEMQRFTRNAV